MVFGSSIACSAMLFHLGSRNIELRRNEAARFQRPLDNLEPVTLAQLAVARDVISIGVRRQEVRDREAEPLDGLVQRLERRAGIHEDARPALSVRDQIGVRKPGGMHAPLDDHRGYATSEIATRRAKWPG